MLEILIGSGRERRVGIPARTVVDVRYVGQTHVHDVQRSAGVTKPSDSDRGVEAPVSCLDTLALIGASAKGFWPVGRRTMVADSIHRVRDPLGSCW
jgi:hypothetical protein